MKHLTVLHEAGLIRIERRGRERLNHLNPTPIQRIYRRWIQPFEAVTRPKAPRSLRPCSRDTMGRCRG
jgi:DNA-binding transcriptional ArsR family regulator